MAPRTPLRNPRAYFRERGFQFAPAALAVGVAVVTVIVALLGFAVLLSRRLRSAGHSDAADAVWGVFTGQVLAVAFALVVAWLLLAAILHVFARVAISHEGSFGQTMVLAGWGVAPTVLGTVVAFGFLAVALGDVSVAGPEAFVEEFRAELAGTSGVQSLVSLLVSAWQAYIWGHGLEIEFEDESGTAWMVAGVVAVGGWLLSLL